MSNASKFRKKAVEYEQLKQFDRAVASYVRAIEENEAAGEEVDVALFNKVGDLTLRQGRVTEAVTYYERAVEHYVSGALFDNAIALCNKILRNAPGRSNVYFTLGRICGRKGLRSDATRNFLEYATRMQADGRIDEGMRALAEIADLMPELTEVGRLVQEHATRAGIALPQRRRPTPAQPSSAQTTNAAGKLFGLSKDLVFLDIEYDSPKAIRGKTPPLVRTVRVTPPVPTKNLIIEYVNDDLPEDDFADAEIDSVVAEVLAQTESVAHLTDAVTISAAAEATAHADVVDATTDAAPIRLEDLLSFDPAEVHAEVFVDGGTVAPTTVDDASLLRPLVAPEMSLSPLDDFEPTEHVDARLNVEEIKAQPTLPELLERGVSRSRDDAAASVELPMLEPLEPATHGDDVAAHDAWEMGALTPLVVDADAIEFSDTIIALNETAVANPFDEEFVPLVSASGLSEFETIELPASADIEFTSIAPSLDAESLFNDDELEMDVLDEEIVGFASEEYLHASQGHIPEAGQAVPDAENVAQSNGFVALDLDAMLHATENSIAPIDDLESEEFAPINDEIAAKMFAHRDEIDDDARTHSDAFDAIDELPALIFPMPFDAYPFTSDDSMEAGLQTHQEDALFREPDSFADSYEAPTFEPPAFDDVSFEPTAFEPSPFETAALEETTFDAAPFEESTFDAAPFDAADFGASASLPSFDGEDESELDDITAGPNDSPEDSVPASYDSIESEVFTIPAALPFIVEHDDFESVELDEAPSVHDTRDLDDLFVDADIPIAVVAAEAAAVASSRRDELRNAVTASPMDWTLRRRLAEALFEAGERDAAIAELSAALAGHESANALVQAAEIADDLVRVAGDRVGHHQKRVELAIRLSDQNRLREAYLDLADNLVRNGDDLRARAVYARVLEIDPWDVRARTALGDAAPPPPERIVAGSDDDKIDLASWLRDDDEPQSTRLRMREPDMSGNEQEDFNSLLRHFKEGVARSLGEDDHDSHYDLGVAYKEMGLLDDAIGEFQKALRSRNNRLAAYEALGQCFIEQQSYKVAVTVLSRALHEPAIRDEQRVGVLYLLGYSCEVLQRFDEARSYFQRVYATDIHFRDVARRLADLERITR
jgi:tetratricopeptide (TPR) repeat protein